MSVKSEERLKYWVALIEEANASEETIVSWIARRGITRSQFYYWHKKANDMGLLGGDDGPDNSEGAADYVPKRVPVVAEIRLSEDKPFDKEYSLFNPQIMVKQNSYQVYIGKGFLPETLRSVMEVLAKC